METASYYPVRILSALAALLEYFEELSKSFVKGTLRISYSSAEGVMILDQATIANLEILRNLRSGCPKVLPAYSACPHLVLSAAPTTACAAFLPNTAAT